MVSPSACKLSFLYHLVSQLTENGFIRVLRLVDDKLENAKRTISVTCHREIATLEHLRRPLRLDNLVSPRNKPASSKLARGDAPDT